MHLYTRTVSRLTIRTLLFAQISSMIVCEITNENSNNCEVHYFDRSKTITCIRGDELEPSLIPETDILESDCEGVSTTGFRHGSSSDVKKLESIGCFLKPRLFAFLYLPNVDYFNSKPNLKYFTSEPSIYNSVLFNDAFEGLCHLKIIDLSYNSIETIQPAAFRCLGSAQHLNLSNNEIEFLPSSAFRGMRQLTHLNLGENFICELSLGLFNDLSYLRMLDLRSNNLSSLPEELFQLKTSLQSLILRDNHLSNLSKDIFSDLTELVDLDLANNKLTYLDNILPVNGKLESLDISSNDGLVITNETLLGQTALTVIYIEKCGLTSIPSRMFADTTSLTYAYMDGNNIANIDSETFMMLEKLEELVLSDNSIDMLDGPFKNLSLLEVLALSNNKLSEIKLEALQGLSSLLTLDLSKNTIESIEDNSFDHLLTLKRLDMSDNLLSSLSRQRSSESLLSKLEALEQLVISNNKLVRLTNAFLGNGYLSVLVISKNEELELDSKSFAGLFLLRHLYMEACNIQSLPNEVFADLKRLETLNVQNNYIKEINSNAFNPLRNLRKLHLDFNNITTLGYRTFAQNADMQSLHLSNNKLQEIRLNDFEGLSMLRFLDISSNHIKNISFSCFQHVQDLGGLNMSYNLIDTIEYPSVTLTSRKILPKCSSIDLSHNNLADIKSLKWQDMPNLFELLLAGNKMTEFQLPMNMTYDHVIHLERNNIRNVQIVPFQWTFWRDSDPTSKPKIYLNQNPLECDCQAYEFYGYVKDHDARDMDFVGGLQCQSPAEHLGKQLTSLNSTDFVCNITESCPTDCSCTNVTYEGTLMVNCSNRDYKVLPVQAPTNTNVLLIDGNNLTSLAEMDASVWRSLTSLNAENNSIEDEHLFVPPNLMFLGLRGNKLRTLPLSVRKHAEVIKDFKISLSNNSWPCDCSIVPIKLWLLQHLNQVIDVNEIRCIFANSSVNPLALTTVENVELCPGFEEHPMSTSLDTTEYQYTSTQTILYQTNVSYSTSSFTPNATEYQNASTQTIPNQTNVSYSTSSLSPNATEYQNSSTQTISYQTNVPYSTSSPTPNTTEIHADFTPVTPSATVVHYSTSLSVTLGTITAVILMAFIAYFYYKRRSLNHSTAARIFYLDDTETSLILQPSERD